MPYFWTSDDTRRAIISTLLPAGAITAGAVILSRDIQYQQLLESTRRPTWAPKDRRIYSALDIVTASPLGYASYLVYKYGGGFDYTDTTIALGLYGANLTLAVAAIPLLKKRNLKALFWNAVAINATAAAAAVAFYKIDKIAGYWMIPYVFWTGFYAVFGYNVYKINSKTE